MRKVLINLDRSTERLGTFYRVNKHIKDVERFSAVDGKGLRSSLKESGMLLEDADALYTDGALGCALSHAEQWRRVISSGGGRTIIEDDAVFCKNFEEEHKRLLKTLPETWDIILWGRCSIGPLLYDLLPGFASCIAFLDIEGIRKNLAMFPEMCMTSNLFKLYKTWGTVCYSISPKGAKKCLEFCFPIKALDTWFPYFPDPVPNRGIDCSLTALYPEIEAYVCFPPLVVTPDDQKTSTVQNQ